MVAKVALTKSQTVLHERLLRHLLATREKLMMVDPQSLTLDQHMDWNEEVYQLGLAINAAQRAILTAISREYADKLAAIEHATDELTDDLYQLKKASDAIAVVGSVLGTISSVVTMLG